MCIYICNNINQTKRGYQLKNGRGNSRESRQGSLEGMEGEKGGGESDVIQFPLKCIKINNKEKAE